jgi:hypothetical protein
MNIFFLYLMFVYYYIISYYDGNSFYPDDKLLNISLRMVVLVVEGSKRAVRDHEYYGVIVFF